MRPKQRRKKRLTSLTAEMSVIAEELPEVAVTMNAPEPETSPETSPEGEGKKAKSASKGTGKEQC